MEAPTSLTKTLLILFLLLATEPVRAQAPSANPNGPASAEPGRDRWYFQWGYNTESYAPVDIRFEQPGLGNDFTLSGHVHDHKSWDFWNHPITVPEYSIRIGYFIKQNTAIELNFDHAKAILDPESQAHLTGTIDGQFVDQDVTVGDYVQSYKLNNGANFILANLVQRFPLSGTPETGGNLALLAKAGLGFMQPHTENTVLGVPNQSGFQYGGLGAGLEAALRLHAFDHFFLEVGQKGFYGHYQGLNIDQGKASHDLWAYVTILSLGVAL